MLPFHESGYCAVSSGAERIGPMRRLTTKDLARHLELLKLASTQDKDELLTDLLVKAYPTKQTQNQ